MDNETKQLWTIILSALSIGLNFAILLKLIAEKL